MSNPKEETQKQNIEEAEEELGSWTREMCKPENLDPRVFHSADEMLDALWGVED